MNLSREELLRPVGVDRCSHEFKMRQLSLLIVVMFVLLFLIPCLLASIIAQLYDIKCVCTAMKSSRFPFNHNHFANANHYAPLSEIIIVSENSAT